MRENFRNSSCQQPSQYQYRACHMGHLQGFFFLNNINKFHIQLIIIELQLCCRQHARYNYKHLFSQPQNKLCEDGHVICLTLPSTSFSCLPYLVSKSYWITHQNMSESDHSLSLPLLLQSESLSSFAQSASRASSLLLPFLSPQSIIILLQEVRDGKCDFLICKHIL